MANDQDSSKTASWPMIGGDGPRSYAQNSNYQKGFVDAAKGMINEGITDKLDFKNPCFDISKTFRIADFGCSVGPNTFLAVENIIEAIEHKYNAQLQNPPPLEFQVFFNDVTNNDFNTLFKTLSSYQNYFAAGVPGSFYSRLFPKSSLHFAYSSYALHWLSKLPKEIVEVNSPAWNKGSIQCTGFVEQVARAYAAQFKDDMDIFLNARAEEIVGGGLMAIIIAGLPDGVLMSETGKGKFYDLLGSSLIDMAKLGVISEEKVDSFNLPLYFSSAKELAEIIKRNGHFSIERMDRVNNTIPIWQTTKPSMEVNILHFRAVIDAVLKEHFGNEDIVDKIIEFSTMKYADNCTNFDGVIHQDIDHFILLKRNIN